MIMWFSLPVVFAYYEEWSEMVSDLREKAKEMMRGYEKACKEKKVINNIKQGYSLA